MGTLNFTVTLPGRTGRFVNAAGPVSTTVITSGSFTTGLAAANVEDGSGDITLSDGQILRVRASEPMWINFGATAAVGTGFHLGTNNTVTFACDSATAGTVSVIDVS